MSKKMFLLCLTVVFLILPSFALSQTQEIKDYKIMKGDTLWDISSKELSDPFLWPKVWKENPEIKNPDRIYPDQSIKIPLYLIQQKEKKEETIIEPVVESKPIIEKTAEKTAEKIEPAKPRYLIDKNMFMASGFISDAVTGELRISGSPSGKNLFGKNDLVYIKTDKPLNIGDKFYIVRAGELVKHPVTKQKVGYVVEVLGIAEITKFEYGEKIAKITSSFSEINTDDLLTNYYEMIQPPASKHYRRPAVDGYIIAARSVRLINATSDIVYIDKGKKDGIEVGDILKTIEVKESKAYNSTHKVPNGKIQVINCMDNTSTAIVRESTDPISAGNLIVQSE
jgi:RNAse (barnase) inhibitor barstar